MNTATLNSILSQDTLCTKVRTERFPETRFGRGDCFSNFYTAILGTNKKLAKIAPPKNRSAYFPQKRVKKGYTYKKFLILVQQSFLNLLGKTSIQCHEKLYKENNMNM